MERGEDDLDHAAAILRYYVRQVERGWRHIAVDYDFCGRALARLGGLKPSALSESDRQLLRRIADLLVEVEPIAFAHTASKLRQRARPAAGPAEERRDEGAG